MKGLSGMDVDFHERGVIRHWLRTRTFQVKLRAPNRTCFSGVHPVSKGLPQGGVLSPILWPIFFDIVTRELAKRRVFPGGKEVRHRNVIFAGDVTMLISAEDDVFAGDVFAGSSEPSKDGSRWTGGNPGVYGLGHRGTGDS